MVDISRAFNTSSETVSDFFQRPGVGCYIPLYQREYSWDKENVDQLIEDIRYGVQSGLSKEIKIRFLGTIIIVKESNPDANINPQDRRALPPRIDNIIDGQQRLSTIALLSCILYQKLFELLSELTDGIKFLGMQEAVEAYLKTLKEVFSFDLGRGSPQRKPIIIRGSIDGWTFDGDDNNYKSDVASYVASFIRAVESGEDFPKIPGGSLVGENLKRIGSLLIAVENSHQNESEDYPTAQELLNGMSQNDIWSYERPELASIATSIGDSNVNEQSQVCSLIQIFAFCNYLLRCCCFTIIEPVSDEWAFDMFQSLNATGTPLTAIETFKPLVVNYVNSHQNGFKDSKAEEYFTQVDELLSPLKTASSKTKLTNDYLTLFGLVLNGEKKPSRQFSAQRKWLVDQYEDCSNTEDKEEFIRRMSNTARFWKDIVQFSPNQDLFLANIVNSPVDENLRKQAAFCCLYLNDANHKMANTILSRFYAPVLRQREDSVNSFISICKSVAAYFTLWRSSSSNTGLDNTYRKLLRDKISWACGDDELTPNTVKEHFIQCLREKGIADKDSWKSKAVQYLRFNNAKVVCRFALFLAAHDTISDVDNPGLMKVGQPNSYPYIDPVKWKAKGLSTLEHVAPQSPSSEQEWETSLYGPEDDYQLIGNLLLLPTKVNSSASNKQWLEKYIYYQHLAETDPDNLASLKQEAESNGILLKIKTIDLLKKADHQHHIKPVIRLGRDGEWNRDFVSRRTERICDILWDRIWPWLQV